MNRQRVGEWILAVGVLHIIALLAWGWCEALWGWSPFHNDGIALLVLMEGGVAGAGLGSILRWMP